MKEIIDLPYETRLLTLGLPTLTYRRSRNDLIQVYKIVNKIDQLKTEDFFEVSTSKTRGHSMKLNKAQNRLNLRANAFSQRVVNNWNSLSEGCIGSTSVNSFKSNLNEFWKKHPKKFSSTS